MPTKATKSVSGLRRTLARKRFTTSGSVRSTSGTKRRPASARFRRK